MKFKHALLHRSKSSEDANINVDTPEGSAARGVRLFCESGSPANAGEEVLHLPVIVEAAESSPQAALSAAYQIRRFLSKDNYNRPHVQYNSIMLIRILSENPGPTFTRCLDGKFVDTVKALLKGGRDASVQQILRETLDSLEAERGYDEGLHPLLSMWRHTKGSAGRIAPGYATPNAPQSFHVPAYNQHAPPVPPSEQQTSQRNFQRATLPPPHELASRVEEARNSGKILLQLVQSTPTEEVLSNDLMAEFSERCQSAQRSLQGFINCDSPPPDDDTMQTLIEVNEQLSLAMSRHQRAVLACRRALGTGNSLSSELQADRGNSLGTTSSESPPPVPERPTSGHVSPQAPGNAFAGPTTYPSSTVSPVSPADNDFAAPPGPPASLTARLEPRPHDRSSGWGPTTSPTRSPPRAPVPHTAEPAHDPFADPGAQYPAQSRVPTAGLAPPAVHSAPQRPGPGTYYNGVTPSYVGRQHSAADHLTMRGGLEALEDDDGRASGVHHGGAAGVSPVDARQAVTYRY